MKKTTMMLMIAALAAGTAFAEEGNGKQEGNKDKAWGHDGDGKPACSQMCMRGGKDRSCCGAPSPEMRKQMKADQKAIKKLGKAARTEKDDAKKAELVAQLRAKLGEVADRRLAQVEDCIAQMKARLEEDKANRDSQIEERLQRILSGEEPRGFWRGKGSVRAKDGKKDGKGEYGKEDRGHRSQGDGEYRDDDNGNRRHGKEMRGEKDGDDDDKGDRDGKNADDEVKDKD